MLTFRVDHLGKVIVLSCTTVSIIQIQRLKHTGKSCLSIWNSIFIFLVVESLINDFTLPGWLRSTRLGSRGFGLLSLRGSRCSAAWRTRSLASWRWTVSWWPRRHVCFCVVVARVEGVGIELLREDDVEWSDQLKSTKITRRTSSQLARITKIVKGGKDEGWCWRCENEQVTMSRVSQVRSASPQEA